MADDGDFCAEAVGGFRGELSTANFLDTLGKEGVFDAVNDKFKELSNKEYVLEQFSKIDEDCAEYLFGDDADVDEFPNKWEECGQKD